MINESGMQREPDGYAMRDLQNMKDCCAQRESAMAILDRMIEMRETELKELKAFREMLPEKIPNAAEHLMWKWMTNLRSGPTW